jgi:hypothetical protein
MPIKKHLQPRRKDQPHDAVFKAFFSDAKIAKNYILHYTPALVHSRIDLSVFEKSNTAFVNGRFGISFSDVAYETRLTTGGLARLLFLFEHKSYLPAHPVYLQLLDYLLQIWEDDLKNKRPLSLIIPIVVYHGKQIWEQRPFSDYFMGLPAEWEPFIPNFNYLLTDLGQIPLQTIGEKTETEHLRNLFMALKLARDQQQVIDNWEKVFNFDSAFHHEDRDKILLQTLTLYIFNIFDMSKTQIKELNKQLPEPEHSWIDAIPEIFGEKWREEGREESNRNFTAKIIQKFPTWSDSEVAEFVGVTVSFVQKARRDLSHK